MMDSEETPVTEKPRKEQTLREKLLEMWAKGEPGTGTAAQAKRDLEGRAAQLKRQEEEAGL